MNPRRLAAPGNVALVALLAALVVLPSFTSDYFIDFVMTRTLMLGLAAATIVFLSTYGGMISLAQLLLFGVAGFMFGNAALESGARGLNLGWPPWLAVVFALLVVSAVALLLGALASRTTGIYFLMLTLVYGVIGFFFFAQVVTVSGPGGVTSIAPPALLDAEVRLYYAGLVLSALVYIGFRAVGTTPFGLALQGIRDDPVRMASLGFNVPLHRMLAFTLAGFVAGIAGLLNVWWNGQIDPASIATGPTLILLIIAVIGGISHFEGAWLGAFVYVAANNYLRALPFVDRIGITEARFNSVIGVLVLLIMVLSPEGLVGIVARLRGWRRRPALARASEPSPHAPVLDAGGAADHDLASTARSGDQSPSMERRREQPHD